MLDQGKIDAARVTTVAPAEHFIDGRSVPSANGARRDVSSPIDGAVFASIADGGAGDVSAATAAARRAYDSGSWRNQPLAARKRVLLRIAEILEERALDLAVLGVRENGTEIGVAFYAEPHGAAQSFRYYGEAIDKLFGEVAPTASDKLGLIHRVPVGVVGAIVPWNFPLMIAAWKVAPALAAGNSVVVKPSETASLLVLKLAEIAAEAGLPDGVLNVVTGDGAVTGEALALDMDVDVLAFTGSGGVGRRLLEYAGRSNLKRVYLELGGKSANIVFDDPVDLAAAAMGAARAIFTNSGQVCIAGSRLLVHRAILGEFQDALVAATRSFTVGDPLILSHQIGAIHSAGQLAKVEAAVAEARAAGAECLTGGERLGDSGYYFAPTILIGGDGNSRHVREEIFGPVLSVIPFDSDEEAVGIANDSPYGLAAGVWTANLSRAHRMVAALDAGAVHVNCYGGLEFAMPIGGMKQSGNGYDRGLQALDKFVNLKSAWFAL
ncbi:MAG: aldehyde dehydrogenase family protein [Croceibacterium sp.]